MKKEKQIPFTQIPLSVLCDKILRDKDKIIYAIILGKSRLKGYCWASNKSLGEMGDTNEREVRRSLENLEKADYIKKFIETKNNISTRKIYPKLVVEGGQDAHVLGDRTWASTNNNSSIKNYTRRKKSDDFFSSEGKPTSYTGTETFEEDIIYKVTNGVYDLKSLEKECKARAEDNKDWRTTSLYKEVSKLVTNK